MPTIDNIKKQIQEEVCRVLLSFNDEEADKAIHKHFEEEFESFHVMTREEEEEYWKEQGRDDGTNPFEEEAALIWGDGDGRESSIELIPENMEAGKKYYFDWNGNRMFCQKKSVGTDKFEIGIFMDEPE